MHYHHTRYIADEATKRGKNRNHSVRFLLAFALAVSLSVATAQPAHAEILQQDQVGNGISVSAARVASPDVSAPRICVINDGGETLFSRDADTPCKIASTTKMMTAIVACEYDPSLSREIVVSAEAAATPGSAAAVVEGDIVTTGEALKGIMLPSGNDMAVAVSEELGRDMLEDDGDGGAADASREECISRFVKAMNDKASELGLSDTLFANACGLDDEGYEGDHHSTARDVVKIAAHAMGIDAIRDVVSLKEADMAIVRDGKQTSLKEINTNRVLAMDERFDGVKTGFTDLAGACLCSSLGTACLTISPM